MEQVNTVLMFMLVTNLNSFVWRALYAAYVLMISVSFVLQMGPESVGHDEKEQSGIDRGSKDVYTHLSSQGPSP